MLAGPSAGVLAVEKDPSLEIAVDARRAWNTALTAQLPEQKLNALRTSLAALKRIRTEHPDSEMAARLNAKELVAGLTIERVQEEIGAIEADLGPCFSAPTRACLAETAEAEARSLEAPDSRGVALAHVAFALARAGKLERAARLRDEALELARGEAIEAKSDVMEGVVWATAYLGEFDRAFQLLEEVEPPLLRAWSYHNIVTAHVDRGQDATATIERFEAYIEELQDPLIRAEALALLAAGYNEIKQVNRALVTVYDAVGLAEGIVDWSASDATYALVTPTLAQVGEFDWALRVAATEIADPSFRCVAHALMASSAAWAGHDNDARRAIELGDQLCPDPDEAEGLTEFAHAALTGAQAMLGDFAAAIERARKIGGYGDGRAWAIAEIAVYLPE